MYYNPKWKLFLPSTYTFQHFHLKTWSPKTHYWILVMSICVLRTVYNNIKLACKGTKSVAHIAYVIRIDQTRHYWRVTHADSAIAPVCCTSTIYPFRSVVASQITFKWIVMVTLLCARDIVTNIILCTLNNSVSQNAYIPSLFINTSRIPYIPRVTGILFQCSKE